MRTVALAGMRMVPLGGLKKCLLLKICLPVIFCPDRSYANLLEEPDLPAPAMCRLCDKIGPICPWRAKRSLEAYFAEWPCSDCEPDDDETTSDGSDTCLLGQPGTDGCPGGRPPQSPTEAVPRAAPARLVVLRPGTVAPLPASPENPVP